MSPVVLDRDSTNTSSGALSPPHRYENVDLEQRVRACRDLIARQVLGPLEQVVKLLDDVTVSYGVDPSLEGPDNSCVERLKASYRIRGKYSDFDVGEWLENTMR